MGVVYPKFAAGLRRLRPEAVKAIATAERFVGLPPNLSRGRILAAFKRAAPCLGIAPRLRDAVDTLMAYSQPQDWEADSRPIVWPSNSALQEQLGLCRRQVQYLIRALVDERLVVPVDSPTGRRWGRRHPVSGKIVEAYGFDLSPLAVRYTEFMAAAEHAREDREARARLRRRLTIARKAIRQISEAAFEADLAGRDWQQWAKDAAAEDVGSDAPLQALLRAVRDLEARRLEGEAVLKAAFVSEDNAPSDALDCTPITTTNQPLAENSATCKNARKHESSGGHGAIPLDVATRPKEKSPEVSIAEIRELETEALTPRFVLKVSPPLRPYIVNPKPGWPDIVRAADWVRADLGISRHAWIEACETMGRTAAAAAIAVIAAKSEEIGSAGGYLRGMTQRAREGTLHLSRSFYGLAERQQRTLT
jgi:replication initiation protein RepC